MAATNAAPAVQRSPLKLWQYLASILCLFILLLSILFLWTRYVGAAMPISIDGVLLMMAICVVLLPLTVVAFVVERRLRQTENMALEAAKQAEQLRLKEQQALGEQSRREFTLEVLGLGAVFDHLQHEALWQALLQGDPYTSVRNRDPKRYPWPAAQKLEHSATQAGAVFAQAVQGTPIYWVAPLLHAAADPQCDAIDATASTRQHRFAIAECQPAAPERIVEQAFALFDNYPDVPYVVVFADNSLAQRERMRDPETASLARDGYGLPAIPDAVAILVLGRRDRVSKLRAHAWEDPKNDYIRLTNTRAWRACQPSGSEGGKGMPAIADWLVAAAALAQAPLRYDGIGTVNMKAWDNDPPCGWLPTPWLPVAWTQAQFQAFDQLPVLALIHRPVHIVFEGEHGQRITRNDRRQELLMAAWREALQSLPGSVRQTGPVRIIASTGDNQRQLLALHGLLHQYAAQGGPEIDTSDLASFTDMGRRLGDAGPAALPLQLVLGVLASHTDGGVSAIIHMRTDGTGATIVFVRPMEEGPCVT